MIHKRFDWQALTGSTGPADPVTIPSANRTQFDQKTSSETDNTSPREAHRMETAVNAPTTPLEKDK